MFSLLFNFTTWQYPLLVSFITKQVFPLKVFSSAAISPISPLEFILLVLFSPSIASYEVVPLLFSLLKLFFKPLEFFFELWIYF